MTKKLGEGDALLKELLGLGARPVPSLAGGARFMASRGAIDDALRARIDAHRPALNAAIERRFKIELPPLAAPAPAVAEREDAVAALARTRDVPRGVLKDGPFHLHRGDWRVEGKVIGAGRVLIVAGDMVVDGPVLTFGAVPDNWIVGLGDLRCTNLVVVPESNLWVAGAIEVGEVACAATRDSSATCGGVLRAALVVSGLSRGCFSVGGRCEAATVLGYVADREGEVLADDHRGKPRLRKELVADGEPDLDALIEVIAMGRRALAPAGR